MARLIPRVDFTDLCRKPSPSDLDLVRTAFQFERILLEFFGFTHQIPVYVNLRVIRGHEENQETFIPDPPSSLLGKTASPDKNQCQNEESSLFHLRLFSVFSSFLEFHHISNLEARSRADLRDGHLFVQFGDQ